MISISISSSISNLFRSIFISFSLIPMYSTDFLEPLSSFRF